MGSESPTWPGLLADPAPRSRIEPVRYAVQVALVLYLLPVIGLVAAIGGSAIVVGRLARLVAKAAASLAGKSGRTPQPGRRVIGSRPILGQKKPKRTRINR